jgi:glycosyltransferase involved in cell wall biosynthesis
MTRLLFLAPSSSLYGGVTRWLVDMNVGLAARGLRCITGLAHGANFHDSDKFRRAYPEVECLVLDGRTGSPSGRREATAAAIRAVRPDVVMPVMLADGLEAAVQAKAQHGFRIVYPVHEVDPGVTRDLHRYAAWLDAIVFADKRSHDLHAASTKGIREDERSRAVVIPCGVPRADHARTPADSGALRIGYCGRVENAGKRAMDLVPLCRELHAAGVNFELVIAGEGSSKAALSSALELLQPQPAVTFLGPLSRESLYRDFYPRIDQLVICSESETGPLVAFEAMVNGCTVVTSDFAGRRDNPLLMDGETCLVFPIGDMPAAARCVQQAALVPDRLRAIATQGQTAALAQRSLEASIDRWQALIEAIMAAPAVRAAQVPHAPRTGGLLSRLGASDRTAEMLRRVARRQFRHASAGEEWPPYFAES